MPMSGLRISPVEEDPPILPSAGTVTGPDPKEGDEAAGGVAPSNASCVPSGGSMTVASAGVFRSPEPDELCQFPPSRTSTPTRTVSS